MKKILTVEQIKLVDSVTLKKRRISSLDLISEAASSFSKLFINKGIESDTPILILCGTGKNGADGLKIAESLYRCFYVSVLIFKSGRKKSPEFRSALKQVRDRDDSLIPRYWDGGDLPVTRETLIIDALLGIGFREPLEGSLLKLVQHVNRLGNRVFAVDIPTGMPSFGPLMELDRILKAEEVITFHSPKFNFLFPESEQVMGRFTIANILLDEEFIESLPSDYSWVEAKDIRKIYKKRAEFSHKGTFGKALIIAGNTRTQGAALLCAEACMQAGAGLTTACVPEASLLALNIRCPEVMFLREDELESRWAEFTVVGIGPGLGERSVLLRGVLALKGKPMLLDADALKALADHPSVLSKLPKNTILTPHMKEFDRIFGGSDSWWERLQLARRKAQEYQIIIVLKNRYTFIVLPKGNVHVNPTGNPAMASGGMGDVLSGIITALLAQGYSAEDAAVLGCYVHGKAGDELVSEGMAVIPASILAAKIPFVLGSLDDR